MLREKTARKELFLLPTVVRHRSAHQLCPCLFWIWANRMSHPMQILAVALGSFLQSFAHKNCDKGRKGWEAAEEAHERQTSEKSAVMPFPRLLPLGLSQTGSCNEPCLLQLSSFPSCSFGKAPTATSPAAKHRLAQLQQETFPSRYLASGHQKFWIGNLYLGTFIKAIFDLQVSQHWSGYSLLCQWLFGEH